MNKVKKIKRIHFVGIKGVGMTPLAIIAKEAGFKVSGSDIQEEFITDPVLQKAGIKPFVGFSKDHIQKIDLVITTGAHGGFSNEEVQFAKQQGIQVLTQGEAVGYFMSGKLFNRVMDGISVSGTHGKTTTTGMIATLLQKAGLDPSYVIGTSSIVSLPTPGHYGKGSYFIAEADEYATEPTHDKTAKFLWQYPKLAVITNIELDHPDIYQSVDEMRNAFSKFTQNISQNGILITCVDDEQVRKLLRRYQGEVITYGFSVDAHYRITKIRISGNQTFFWLETGHASLGEFAVKVSGEHNALNATAAVVVGLQIGMPIEKIKKFLPAFQGSKRRLEYVGESENGILVYDDYAHHPTEIKKTLQALRQAYPTQRIVCIFQPHTYSRTKKLFEQFTHSFVDADEVILVPIYASLRESPDKSVSSERLSQEMSMLHKAVSFLPQAQDMVEYVKRKPYKRGTIVVTMGAGDIYKIDELLLKS